MLVNGYRHRWREIKAKQLKAMAVLAINGVAGVISAAIMAAGGGEK